MLITLEKTGPDINAVDISAYAEELGVQLPDPLMRLFREVGNGGYIEGDLSVTVPETCGHEFGLNSMVGVNHPDPNLDLKSVFAAYVIDRQMPAGIIPIFEDAWGSWLCMTSNEPYEIVYWCPDEGHPDEVVSVFGSLQEVLSAARPFKPEPTDMSEGRSSMFSRVASWINKKRQ